MGTMETLENLETIKTISTSGRPVVSPYRLMGMETMNRMNEMNPLLIPQASSYVADVYHVSQRSRQTGVFIGFISFIVANESGRADHRADRFIGKGPESTRVRPSRFLHATAQFTPLREGGWRGAPGGERRTSNRAYRYRILPPPPSGAPPSRREVLICEGGRPLTRRPE